MPVTRKAKLGALAATLLVPFVLAACGGGGSSTTSSSLPAGCQDASKPPPKHVHLKRPKQSVRPAQKLTAKVDTSCGGFEIALDTKHSPKTVNSFSYLARRGVYNDTTFHRIVPNFVIQGGDPLGTGEGGPGYTVSEPPPSNTQYTRGVVAMAKPSIAPIGQSGSQFFVVTATDAGLPPNYAVLGKVSSGQDVVRRIASLGDPASGQTGTPLETVVIRRITVKGG
jgi:peptidyl-prolyl cis-trans isomerase B (cyclophilin B)